tara:strand:+ start:329 stop:619 length:291 start_codon:yes stop_codon:yes gene_type:complete
MMEKTAVIGVFGLVIIAFLFGLTFDKSALTGNVVRDELSMNYTYTRAICNEDNKCIDVLIECGNGEVQSLEPISDLRFFGSKYEDFSRKEIDDFCE